MGVGLRIPFTERNQRGKWIRLNSSFGRTLGYWVDPCVEDALRCIVYHANNPNSDKCWFDFTEGRKSYRAQNGYPATRPSLAWYEIKK